MASNNRIRTALLSYGMSGKVFHAPLILADPHFELCTIVKHKKEVTPPAAGVRVVDDMESVFNDPSIELIVVNTPNNTHLDLALEALRMRKHVIVEKPFTVTFGGAEALIKLAKERQLMLTVFQSRRWDSDFLTVRKIVNEGKLGRLVEYEARYDRYRTHIEPNTWKEEYAPGTGILYNLGSHMIDQVLVLFGMPLGVDAKVGIQRTNGRVDDYYDIRLYYNGFQAIVKSSYIVRESGPRYTLHGTLGSFVKRGSDLQEEALKQGRIPGEPGWGEEPEEMWGLLNVENFRDKVKSEKGNYAGFYKNVFDHIRNKEPLDVKPEESANVIRVIVACYKSNAEHRTVEMK